MPVLRKRLFSCFSNTAVNYLVPINAMYMWNLGAKYFYRRKFGPLSLIETANKNSANFSKLEQRALLKLIKFNKIHKILNQSDIITYREEYRKVGSLSYGFSLVGWAVDYSIFSEDYEFHLFKDREQILGPWLKANDIAATPRFILFNNYILPLIYSQLPSSAPLYSIPCIDYFRRHERNNGGIILDTHYDVTTYFDLDQTYLKIIRQNTEFQLVSKQLRTFGQTFLKVIKTELFSLSEWGSPIDPNAMPLAIPRYFFERVRKKTKDFSFYPTLRYCLELQQEWQTYACRPIISFKKHYQIIKIMSRKVNDLIIYKIYFSRRLTVLPSEGVKFNGYYRPEVIDIAYGVGLTRDTWPPLLLLPFSNKVKKSSNNRISGIREKRLIDSFFSD
jgi:hypothetical protein